MDQKAARAAIAKVLKQAGFKARKGQLRLGVGDLWWYVGVRAASPGAPLVYEVGCWVPALVPEPEGGPVDCPLLLDVPVGEEPAASAASLTRRLADVGSLDALAAFVADHDGVLVDRALREVLPSR
jgi:hypothetical protein